MTDYKKLKAFAEELAPNCFDRASCFKHDNRKVVDTQWWNGGVSIFNGDQYYMLSKGDHTGQFNEKWDSVDHFIKETREYWREMGLPSLQVKELTATGAMIKQQQRPNDLIIDDLSPLEWYKFYIPSELGKRILEMQKKPYGKLTENKPKNIMKSIKETLKTLTLSKDEKVLIQAGLMTKTTEWSSEAEDFADELLREERMAQPDFKEKMLKVAGERNKDCN